MRNWSQPLSESLPQSRLEAADLLVRTAEAAIPLWLDRCVRTIVASQRLDASDLDSKIATFVQQVTPLITSELRDSVTGVRADNPLSVFRRAVAFPTLILAELGATAVQRDQFAMESFPNDVYGLSPATWNDIDESLHNPGIIWGAWTAREAMDRGV